MNATEYPVRAYIDPLTTDPELWFAADMSGVRHYHEYEATALQMARAANVVIAKHARLNPAERDLNALIEQEDRNRESIADDFLMYR